MSGADSTDGAVRLAEFLSASAGFIWAPPIALLLSLLLPVAVRPLLQRLGVMDVPNERSSHERPVLRGLGLAVLIAMAVAGAVAWWALSTSGTAAWQGQMFAAVTIGGLLAGLLGLSEDLRGLSVPVRSALLLLLAASAAAALLWSAQAERGGVVLALTPGLSITDVGVIGLVLLGVYAVLFVSSYINVANFMDGLNGISGFHGVIAGLSFAVAGVFAIQTWLICAGLILAAGFAGFLPWNLTKPGAFLGDVGSYLLGGATAITSFAALLAGVPILATIGPMVVYFGDVGVTLVKRVRAGRQWDEPHKEHVYQRLQQAGRSHVAASRITAGFTVAASMLGLASFFVSPAWWIALLVAGVALVVLYALLPRLLDRR